MNNNKSYEYLLQLVIDIKLLRRRRLQTQTYYNNLILNFIIRFKFFIEKYFTLLQRLYNYSIVQYILLKIVNQIQIFIENSESLKEFKILISIQFLLNSSKIKYIYSLIVLTNILEKSYIKLSRYLITYLREYLKNPNKIFIYSSNKVKKITISLIQTL